MAANSSPHTATTPPSSSPASNRLAFVVDIDEARSPLLFYGVRPTPLAGDDNDEMMMMPTTTTSDKARKNKEVGHREEDLSPTWQLGCSAAAHAADYKKVSSSSSVGSPTTTSIQYLEDPTQIDRMFRFDKETLGLFGTARQRRKRQQDKSGFTRKPDESAGCDESNGRSSKKPRNSHSRAVLHSALDLRCMEYKVVKIIEKNKLPASSGGDKLWRRLCHKLLRVTNSHQGLMHITDVIETDATFYLVSERLEGSELFEFLLLERAVPEELCKYLIKQILHSLDFLHSNSLLHRDVKPENLMFRRARRSAALPSHGDTQATASSSSHRASSPASLVSTADSLALTEEFRKQQQPLPNSPSSSASAAKHRPMSSLECSRLMSLEDLRIQFELALIDFDTCKMIDIPSSEYHEVFNGRRRLVGTYGYLAPEVLRGHEYTMQSDLWSVGVILYILMTGVPPVPMDLMINARSALEVLQDVKRKGIDFRLAPLPEFPKAQDLCSSLLEFDPPRRIVSAKTALNHPWLNPSASNTIPFMPFLKPSAIVADAPQQQQLLTDDDQSNSTPHNQQQPSSRIPSCNPYASGRSRRQQQQHWNADDKQNRELSSSHHPQHHQRISQFNIELMHEQQQHQSSRSGSPECQNARTPPRDEMNRGTADRFNNNQKQSPTNNTVKLRLSDNCAEKMVRII